MISASCGGVRVVSIYAPNGRTVGSPFYRAKLAWFDAARALASARRGARTEPLVLGGDFNVAPDGRRRLGSDAPATAGRTFRRRSGRRSPSSCGWGLVDAYRLHHPEPERYTWWDYRAGDFHKNFGMRIDHLLVTRRLSKRVVWAEIDREARKGKPHPVGSRAARHRSRRGGLRVRRRLVGRRSSHRLAPLLIRG